MSRPEKTNDAMNEMARLFELLGLCVVEGMPNDVDFAALAQYQQELLDLTHGKTVIPVELTLQYQGKVIRFKGELTTTDVVQR